MIKMKEIKIGLLGCGTVGTGVAKILLHKANLNTTNRLLLSNSSTRHLHRRILRPRRHRRSKVSSRQQANSLHINRRFLRLRLLDKAR